jgi:hypothetical protein
MVDDPFFVLADRVLFETTKTVFELTDKFNSDKTIFAAETSLTLIHASSVDPLTVTAMEVSPIRPSPQKAPEDSITREPLMDKSHNRDITGHETMESLKKDPHSQSKDSANVYRL